MHMAQALLQEEGGGGGPGQFKSATIFGYPVISAFAVPIWAATADPTMLPDIVHIQLEKHNLAPDNPVGQLVDTKIVGREDSQTLVLASVLNESVAPDLPQQRPTSYEISPYLYYLPEDSIVIWKELGRLVLCVTRQEHPAYFHALSHGEINADAVGEIERLMMPLYMQGVVGELKRVVVWTEDVAPGALKLLEESLHLVVKRDRKPSPAPPAEPATFEPTKIALEKIRQAKLRRIKNIASVCAAVYAAIVALLIGKYLWKVKANADLQARVEAMARPVEFVEPTLRKWNQTAALRDKNRAPLEIINRVLGPLYKFNGGVRVTNIRLEPDSVEIKGEAQLQPSAITYGNTLLTNKELKAFAFNAPSFGPPRGGIFTFTIVGKLKTEDELNGGT